MSVLIDLTPSMVQEAREYANVRGTTLERLLIDCIAAELKRGRERAEKATRLMDEWRDVVRKGRGRRNEAYKFNRADAYPEGEYA